MAKPILIVKIKEGLGKVLDVFQGNVFEWQTLSFNRYGIYFVLFFTGFLNTACNNTVTITSPKFNSKKPSSVVAPFVSVWRIPADNLSADLPLVDGYEYNFTVDWGDGSPLSRVVSFDDLNAHHNYSQEGDFIVTIRGQVQSLNFDSSTNNAHLKIIEVTDLGNVGWVNLSHAFAGCANLTSFSGGETSSVTDMSSMFEDDSALVNLDLSSFNTSNVNTMDSMFAQVENLTSLDLSSFDTSKVTNMSHMFYSATSLVSVNLSSFNTSNVLFMNSMFAGDSSLTTLDLSSFNTSSVLTMNSIFDGDSSLSTLKL